MNALSMYLDFRNELDKICVPEILKVVNTLPIWYDEKQVGMLCYVENAEGFTYIDCLYVVPEYRRKGLARHTVNEFLDKHKGREIRLHIINKNRIAYNFWTSFFELEEIEGNFVDTLYKIKGVRK